jgi:hypothetical protein
VSHEHTSANVCHVFRMATAETSIFPDYLYAGMGIPANMPYSSTLPVKYGSRTKPTPLPSTSSPGGTPSGAQVEILDTTVSQTGIQGGILDIAITQADS